MEAPIAAPPRSKRARTVGSIIAIAVMAALGTYMLFKELPRLFS